METSNAHRGFGTSALLIGMIIVIGALPYLPPFRRHLGLYPISLRALEIPTELGIKVDLVEIPAGILTVPPAGLEAALIAKLKRVENDPQMEERSVRLARIHNRTRGAIPFRVCEKPHRCFVNHVLAPGEQIAYRWPQGDLLICFDSEYTSGFTDTDRHLVPAIATADAQAPPQPLYAFVPTEKKFDLVFQGTR